MSQPITMPALSDTMSNGRLVKWVKKPGDAVHKGDIIAEVETDKAVMEVEAFQDGYLSGPLVEEGVEAPVGQIIGYISDSPVEIAATTKLAEPRSPRGADGANSSDTSAAVAPMSAVLAASMTGQPPVRRHFASAGPARSSAAPSPAVVTLEAATSRAPASNPALFAIEAGPPYRLERASSSREAVARNMIASAAAPIFRVTAQLSLDPLLKSAQEARQSLTLLLARACAFTIVAHPLFNAAYTPEGLARRDRVDIGIAVDDGQGLITPVLRDVANKPIAELSHDWSSLRDKVKNRRLSPAEYSGATFYLSNLGASAVVYAFDSIVPIGAAAILSVGASRPEGTLCTLACDHRVVFGADAARFLETLAQQLRDQSRLSA
jgi:pyruvate dehydrogenase E2 component (dihydrolipoamide acetyltransferase)